MNRLLELKEKRAQMQEEMRKLETEIKEEELKKSWLGVFYKAFPNSVWASKKNAPPLCPCLFFGDSHFNGANCDGQDCNVMTRDACWKKEASL